MRRAVIPPVTRVPAGASDATRHAMYRESVAEIVRYNPGKFLPPGVRRRWWHALIGKLEYPKVLQ